MIIRNGSGRQRLTLASVVVCALSINTAYGWQQEYIVDAMSGHTAERYTWDSDHQPRYNDILSGTYSFHSERGGSRGESGG